MVWYSLNDIIQGLTGRGFVPITVSDPGCFVLTSSQKQDVICPKVVLPMGQGDWLPKPIVHKVLSEVKFDVEEFLQQISTQITNEKVS